MAHYQKAIKCPNDYIAFALDPNNIKIIYFMIHGLKDEWENGWFLFEMRLTDKFPFDPPEFYAKNENGLYTPNIKCCISVGEFHSNDYVKVLGVGGFAAEVMNGLINWDIEGIGLIKTTLDEKRVISAGSLRKIQTDYPYIYELICKSHSEYSKRWGGVHKPLV